MLSVYGISSFLFIVGFLAMFNGMFCSLFSLLISSFFVLLEGKFNCMVYLFISWFILLKFIPVWDSLWDLWEGVTNYTWRAKNFLFSLIGCILFHPCSWGFIHFLIYFILSRNVLPVFFDFWLSLFYYIIFYVFDHFIECCWYYFLFKFFIEFCYLHRYIFFLLF